MREWGDGELVLHSKPQLDSEMEVEGELVEWRSKLTSGVGIQCQDGGILIKAEPLILSDPNNHCGRVGS
jgi:hypothetical protein